MDCTAVNSFGNRIVSTVIAEGYGKIWAGWKLLVIEKVL
jgi:hypothetical protein